MNLKTKLLTLALGAGIAGAANGQVVFEDNFNSITGDITTSPNWSKFSGTGNPTVAGGIVSIGAGDGDVEADLGTLSSGTYFFGIDIEIASAAASEYVLGFRDGSTLVSRIFFADEGSGFAIGANTGGTGSGSADGFIGGVTPTVFDLGTTYRLVSSYDGASTVSIWIDPTSGDFASPDLTISNSDGPHTPDAFYFRQGGGWDNGGASWTADNLVVSSNFASAVPEPEMYGALFGLIALGFAVVRRRRHQR